MSAYTELHTDKDSFEFIVRRELEDGITSEYSDKIAEKISHRVAQDICQSADKDHFNGSDVRLAIGRVLLRSLGVFV